MYVCVCNAVTDKQIHIAVAEGARTLKDLKRELGVGAECGRCLSCARTCLKEAAKEASHEHHALAMSKKVIPIEVKIAA